METRRLFDRSIAWKVLTLSALLPLFWVGDAQKAARVPRSLLIVTLDTTRADTLAAYGGAKVETPALDRLAREGIVFEQATSPAPLTLPAHCSLFTGLLPPHHGVRDNVDPPLGNTQITLAETLSGHGMRSAAFVASAVVAARRGLAQGFETYSDGESVNPEPRLRRPANFVVNEAIDWITRQDGTPFFAWVHLYDAHAPYRLPEPYRTMYEDAPYLGAIAFMDAQVGRLLTALDQQHLAEHTLVVVAADHGESLGDHGEDGHGMLLYQSTVHVPLIVRAAGFPPKRVSDVVRLVDVMPTVLDSLGVAGPPMDGVSLVPVMAGHVEHVDLEAYSESLYPRRFGWAESHALRAGRFKFVSAPQPELYDLEKDPEERRNIYDQRRELGAVMSSALTGQAHAPSVAAARNVMEADPESIGRLAALGYVSPASMARDSRSDEPLDDPKDCVGVYNAILRAGGASPLHSVTRRDLLAPPNPAVNAGSISGPMSFAHGGPCSVKPSASGILLGHLPTASEPARPRDRTPVAASR